MHLVFYPVGPWPLVALLSAGVLAAVVWVYLTTLAEHAGRWRAVAFGLRLAALVLALAALLRPALVFTEKRKQSASLILLFDHSRSMMVADAWDGLPRWRAMEQTVYRAEPSLEKLSQLVEIRQYRFDATLGDLPATVQPPTGTQTALGDVLREAVRRATGRVAGVVLLSDGANTSGTPPRSVAQTLKDLGVPIYAVGFGQQTVAESSRDLAMRSISAGPLVFEKNKLVAAGELDVRGFGGQKVRLSMLFDEQQAATRLLELPLNDTRMKVELAYVPVVPGEHKVKLQVSELDPKKGELVESNNEIATFVTVLPGGLRVLYLDGGIESGEATFLCRALNASPDIQVDFRWVQKPLRDDPDQPLFDRARYDAVLLRDVPRGWIPDAALDRLRQSVDSGAGFAMLGGSQSFGPGGYDRTPVGELLPVVIHPGDGQIDRPLQVIPTAAGLGHFVMRLGDASDVASVWQSLAPLRGASAFTEIKPRALVLAEAPDKTPLIVAEEYGQGRTMALAGDTTWQWHLQSDAALRQHRRFWRQVILWLTRKEAGESRVWVRLDKRRLAAGDPLEITTGAQDEHGAAMLDTDFDASVTRPDGTTLPVKLVREADQARGTFWGADAAGDYQVSVSARHGGQELGAPRAVKFLVFEDDSELAAPAADLDLLRDMATLTGGRYLAPEQLSSFFDDLRKQDLHLELEHLTYLRLWDNWPFLALFVTLLSAEWALRKWQGLV